MENNKTSALAIVGFALGIMGLLVDTAAGAIEDKSEMNYDVKIARHISTAVNLAYYDEIVCEDMSSYEGSTVTFTVDGCEAVYVTDGVTFWELYPYTCNEYYEF